METINEGWRLQSLNINYQTYGAEKGQYTGAACFTNGVKMNVNFMLDQDKCNKFLALIQDEIQNHAANLGNMLVSSLPLKIENK